MESYSRLQSEFHNANDRIDYLRKEAEARRALRGETQETALWRARLAAQLHGLAERVEPAAYHAPKGKLL